MKWLRDPLRRSQLVSVMLAAAGLVGIAVAWAGASRTVDVSEQLSFALSGGLGGLALAGAGAASAAILLRRRESAAERRQFAEVAANLTLIADAIAERRSNATAAAPEPEVARPRSRTRRARRTGGAAT